MADESEAISALTGLSLNGVLSNLDLPSGGLSSQLSFAGLAGLPDLNKGSYEDGDDDEIVGADQGIDYEDLVDEDARNDHMVDIQRTVTVPQKRKRTRIVKKLVERPKTVHEIFPSFEKSGILDFTELLKGYLPRKSRIAKRPPFQVEMTYFRKKEVPKDFLKTIVGDAKNQSESQRVEHVVASGSVEEDLRRAIELRGEDVAVSVDANERSLYPVQLADWEDQIILHPDPNFNPSKHPVFDDNLKLATNEQLQSGVWTQSTIWGPGQPFRDFTQLEFNHEDDIVPEPRSIETVRHTRKRFRVDPSQLRDKFNLSNDQAYEVSREGGRHRVRQTFGQIAVEHAYPAQKLQLPFYKTRLSKQEARAFHRPALQIPANIEWHFGKVRTAKKKKDKAGRKLGKGGNVGEGLHKTGDLSLRDTSNFVLLEFSEEHPPVISSFSMGSALVNYYRKKDDNDEFVPKLDLGLPFVLEPQDDSPFKKFGNVDPGQIIPALYNNLVRAPLFRHKLTSTDFLVIRHTVKGDSKYFLREIKNLYVVGQTYPATEVPGPHSRKITTTMKNRLQIIAFKLLRRSQGERLKISRLMKYFPDQNELQMRQRLKEFMEYNRRGEDQGFWTLKKTLTIPSDAEMLKMVTPEQVVLAESMQVGQRHLQDAGYTQTVEQEDEQNLSVEQQLAPWNTTKNFISACQQKAMLQLHGPGDPTGRGEAFSMMRISMKDIFVKAGENYEQKLAELESRPKSAHRYNVAEQQQIYKSEIERIWKAQYDSLSRKDKPQLTQEEADRYYKPTAKQEGGASRHESPSFGARGQSSDPTREGSMGPEASRKVLRIKRKISGEWRTEIIRDPAVIRAYVHARELLEEENTVADRLAPTGDADKDKRARKRLEEEIARMKKNQERRLHRKNAKIIKEGGMPMQLSRTIKPDTTRRCGHCGQVGHMKTNRKCPLWAQFNSGTAPGPSTSVTSPPPMTPGILGFNRGPAFGHPATVSSPLATSPPLSALAMEESGSGSAGPTKLKLTLGKR
ncbi:hypothetical protein FISHEDRAFT_64273 [Fistulina hepatica ATCC 64428]|uniref:Transcription initiation factor TFIID subunit 1 histone acetyltransferase domain-containing protein n=1 Tax=Fistulina hepatica ATCC 64428 TaxID=1128425 RepID=A0A0D7AIW2_9AGAR|nr:hypothetical protein FISHEDRAFT_64273 [Fistulina hepatica ATCC 64428]